MSGRRGETNNDLLREFIEFLPKEYSDRALWLELEPGQVLLSQGRMAEQTLFPVSGLISCFRSLGHRRVEVYQVGRDGVLGFHAALTLPGGEETTTSISMTPVRMIGLPPCLVRMLVMDQPRVREIIYQYLHHQELETNEVLVRSAACPLTARLAFWIVRAHQKLRHEPIPVTHEVLSDIHCVRRPTITDALHELEGLGAIKSLRKQIIVHDREILLQAADTPAKGEQPFHSTKRPSRSVSSPLSS